MACPQRPARVNPAPSIQATLKQATPVAQDDKATGDAPGSCRAVRVGAAIAPLGSRVVCVTAIQHGGECPVRSYRNGGAIFYQPTRRRCRGRPGRAHSTQWGAVAGKRAGGHPNPHLGRFRHQNRADVGGRQRRNRINPREIALDVIGNGLGNTNIAEHLSRRPLNQTGGARAHQIRASGYGA
ncbi:hypothetical protein D3C85_1283450 [compost metagenome]